MKISLLTGGGGDRYYELALLNGLLKMGLQVDFIGGDKAAQSEIFINNDNASFINLRGDQSTEASFVNKTLRVMKYYFRLIKYALLTDSKIFHIQWLNKFEWFDRTVMNVYYKMLGKKIVFTAHNIDAQERDGEKSLVNRLTLRIMYNLVDAIIVHTKKMKDQLVDDFRVNINKIHVIEYGINNMVKKTSLDKTMARGKLDLEESDRVILFFGNVMAYKGLDVLVEAMNNIGNCRYKVKLVIAGRVQKPFVKLWNEIQGRISEYKLDDHIIHHIGFVDDKDIEIYFKAADVLVLPYRYIFQSGILFLAYNFGLPVIATDVGSLKENIISGKTGFMCKPGDPKDLAMSIEKYFESDLYKDLYENRERIFQFASDKYSWDRIAEKTNSVYKAVRVEIQSVREGCES